MIDLSVLYLATTRVFLNCEIPTAIHYERFHDWQKTDAHETVFFAEYNSKGPGSDNSKHADFVKILSDEEAKEYSKEAFDAYIYEQLVK